MIRVATMITESYTTERITHKRYKNIKQGTLIFVINTVLSGVIVANGIKKGHQNVDVKMQTLG